MAWDDERVELLKRLWSEGHSASVCAQRIGGGISRSAVLGKVDRLGLPGREHNGRRGGDCEESRRPGTAGRLD